MTTDRPRTVAPARAGTWFQYAAPLSWSAQVLAAVILAQTLYFKFTYAPETRHIFGPLGGRPAATLVGLMELVCVVLILIPRTAAVGAVLALGLMGGALVTHLTMIGIAVKNPDTGESDGGLLFGLALVVSLCALVVLAFRWRDLPFVGRAAV
ncbi:hypothetical protein GobsT_10650 [Gemmata obscuriglobus]|uniref:hypothetical protein n=1 Tax=Gemmata obscuriglobus TaxID=114 RepID=UPI00016C5694|nr:hypothetical protein [Gemmata obscuriglobus]QEG26326.1 hypothetical protein GobsT_10650 [Gemmata obscuriglobus]VTS01267.1 DoxX family protein OS=Niastella koreensis (strain DSM 17620 / KACC 11465 / GR20-10) GN=Niako_3839 PE=4 SV=1 [Gemmata obscuriglobus UQM 2246]